MTKLMMVLAVIFLMAYSSSVSAEEATVAEASTVMTQEQLCELVRRCQRGEGSAECREARRGTRQAWRRLLQRLSTYETRIEQLEARIGGLADRDSELDRELDRLRDLIGQLTVRIDALQQLMADVEEIQRRLGEIDDEQDRQDEALEEASDRIERLEAQISEVSRRNGVVQISPSGGYVGIYAFDGSYYTGGLLGMRVALRVTRRIGVFVEPMVTLAAGDYPAGTVIRGGLMIHLTDWALLETAVSGMWVGFDAQLDAAAAYLTGDLGVMFRPIDWVELGVTLNTGVELDSCDPAFAIGGEAWFRFNIPSL